MKTKPNQNAPKSPVARHTTVTPQRQEDSVVMRALLSLAVKRICPDVGTNAPSWAKHARQKFLEAVQPGRCKKAASEAYRMGFESGWNHGMADLMLATFQLREQFRRRAASVFKQSRDALKTKVAVEAPENVAADFFAGFRDGSASARSVPERAKVFERTKCFREIATHWRELVQKKTRTPPQLLDWLWEKGLLHRHTDPKAEVRIICRMIGFVQCKKARKPHESA